MAVGSGSWRNPSIRDLEGFINRAPPPDPEYLAWRQQIAQQGPAARYGQQYTGISKRPLNIAGKVRGRLGIGPKGVDIPVQGIEPGSPRYNALRSAFRPQLNNGVGTVTRSVPAPPLTPPGIPTAATAPMSTPAPPLGVPTAATTPMPTPYGTTIAPGPASPIAMGGGPVGANVSLGGPSIARGTQMAPGVFKPPTTPSGMQGTVPGRIGAQSIDATLPRFLRLSGGGAGTPAEMFNVGGGFKGIGNALTSRATTGFIPMMVQGKMHEIFGAPEAGSQGERFENDAVRNATAMGLATGNPLLAAGAGLTAGKNVVQADMAEKQKADLQQLYRDYAPDFLPDELPGPLVDIGQNIQNFATMGAGGRNTIGEKITGGISDLFGKVTGGEEEAQAQADQQAVAAERAATMTPDTLRETMTRIGLNQEFQTRILQNYEQQIALAEANPYTPSLDGKTALSNEEFQALKPEEQVKAQENQIRQDPAKIQQAVWQQSLAMLPQLRAQQDSEDDYIRRTTAMQAALQDQIPRFVQPYQQASDMATAALGATDMGAYSGLANSMAAGFRADNANNANYLATQMATMPGQMALQQNTADRQAIASRIQEAQTQQMLQLQYPDLFPSSSGSSSEDPLMEALLSGKLKPE